MHPKFKVHDNAVFSASSPHRDNLARCTTVACDDDANLQPGVDQSAHR